MYKDAAIFDELGNLQPNRVYYRLQVNVTEEHIRQGRRSSPEGCAVALAVKSMLEAEGFGKARVYVDGRSVMIQPIKPVKPRRPKGHNPSPAASTAKAAAADLSLGWSLAGQAGTDVATKGPHALAEEEVIVHLMLPAGIATWIASFDASHPMKPTQFEFSGDDVVRLEIAFRVSPGPRPIAAWPENEPDFPINRVAHWSRIGCLRANSGRTSGKRLRRMTQAIQTWWCFGLTSWRTSRKNPAAGRKTQPAHLWFGSIAAYCAGSHHSPRVRT
jgi:hypothetical protein